MKKAALAIAMLFAASAPALAEDFATAKDAEALVGKVVKAYTANKDATIKEINAKDKKWVHGDLYPLIQVANPNAATMVAHGANEKLVGKDMSDLVDVDGKSFNRELQEQTIAKGKHWTDFKFKDPVSGKILPKSLYCEKATDVLVCAGIYKR